MLRHRSTVFKGSSKNKEIQVQHANAGTIRPLCHHFRLFLPFNRVQQWCTQEFCSGGGGGGSTNSVEDRGQRERGSGGGNPLVRGSGVSCNLVKEISYSKIFLIFGTLILFMMTTNLFVIANVK